MMRKLTQKISQFNNRNYKYISILDSININQTSISIFIHGLLPLLSENILSITSWEVDLQFLIEESLAYILLLSATLLFDRSKLSFRLNVSILIAILCSGYWIPLSMVNYHFCIISLILLTLFRSNFNNSFYLPYGVIFIIGFLIFALLYGSIGSYILRSEFKTINSFGDAIYFCIITYSTVGYGDIVPITATSRYFVISMVIIGLIMFTSSITLIAYTVNDKLRNVLTNINKGKISMKDHIILLGYGILSRILIEQYRKDGKKFIVVDNSRNMDAEREILVAKKELVIASHMGDNTAGERLRMDEAELIIINYDTDEETIFAIMNVKDYLNSREAKVKIIARIYYENNIEKAKKVGADEIIAPHVLAAQQIFAIKST